MREPKVKIPRLKIKGRLIKKWKKGRGFSKEEIKAAGLTINDIRKLGLRMDKRRKSKHKENIEILRKLISKNLKAPG